jgi:hypothetical protein
MLTSLNGQKCAVGYICLPKPLLLLLFKPQKSLVGVTKPYAKCLVKPLAIGFTLCKGRASFLFSHAEGCRSIWVKGGVRTQKDAI